MPLEIPNARIHELADLFPGPQLAMVIDSVAAGNTAARVWRLDRETDHGLTLLWDQGNNVFYVSGAPSTAGFAFTGGPLQDMAVAAGMSHFKVHALSPALEKALPALFPDCQLSRTIKLFYAHSTPVPSPSAPALDGVEFVPIDRALLDRPNCENVEAVKAEIAWMWPSLERFHRHGLGCAAIYRNALVCWCTAEYVGPSRCGIGIETVPRFHNRGLATATTLRFVDACARHRITPYWECDGANVASQRVAEKAGFEKIEESVFWART